jgi:DNA mismatch repair protein MutL
MGAGAGGLGGFDLLGELDEGYVLLRSPDGLVLMDRRAAHERVLYEDLRRAMESRDLPTQPLLVPATVELPPQDFAFVCENLEILAAAGLGLGEFGPNTVKVDSVPAALDGWDAARIVEAMVTELKAGGSGAAARVGHDELAGAVSRLAVRNRDALNRTELEELVARLLACEMPYCNPAGRPTLVQVSYREIDRKFGKSR